MAVGLRPGPDPGTAEFELVIGGMTCAACAARVQARLNKVAGVTASVNLSTERAWVSAHRISRRATWPTWAADDAAVWRLRAG